MKYCSYCGSDRLEMRVPADDNHLRIICGNCETIHYQNPSIITGLLPVWGEQVMLAKRATEPRYGLWNVAGGFLENGETVEDGAMRELMEETGAKVRFAELLTVFSILQVHQVHLHYWGELLSLDFVPGIESLEVRLFHENEIPWDEIAFSSTRFVLETYFANRKSGDFSVKHGFNNIRRGSYH